MAKAEPAPDDEPITPEVVDRPQPDADVVPLNRGSALERAAEAALALPDLPGRDEFLALAMQARILSMSGAAPKVVQGNPHLAFHIALIGRDLRVSPSAALRLVDVIELKRPTPQNPEGEYQLSLSPELINGVLIREGLGRIVPVHEGLDKCTALALGPRGFDSRCMVQWPVHVSGCNCDVLGPPIEFTVDDARTAGLVGPNCVLGGEHPKDQPRSSAGKSWKVCGCNQGYITYPKTMLWWRACAFAARRYYPEATLGIYTTEELNQLVDEEGRMLDPANVALPEGYEPPELPPAPPDPARIVDHDAVWLLQERIAALPELQRADLRAKWQDSDLKGVPARWLTESSLGGRRFAEAMVASFERQADKADPEWSVDAAIPQVRAVWQANLLGLLGAPVGPPDAEGADGAGSPPPEPPAATDPPEGAAVPPEGSEGATGRTGAVPDEAYGALDVLERTLADAKGGEQVETVEQIVERVAAMDMPAVDAELQLRSKSTRGAEPVRRRRLAELLRDERPFE